MTLDTQKLFIVKKQQHRFNSLAQKKHAIILINYLMNEKTERRVMSTWVVNIPYSTHPDGLRPDDDPASPTSFWLLS